MLKKHMCFLSFCDPMNRNAAKKQCVFCLFCLLGGPWEFRPGGQAQDLLKTKKTQKRQTTQDCDSFVSSLEELGKFGKSSPAAEKISSSANTLTNTSPTGCTDDNRASMATARVDLEAAVEKAQITLLVYQERAKCKSDFFKFCKIIRPPICQKEYLIDQINYKFEF